MKFTERERWKRLDDFHKRIQEILDKRGIRDDVGYLDLEILFAADRFICRPIEE